MKQRLAIIMASLFVFFSGHYAFAEELDIVSFSKQYIGVPYKWGGTTPKGFDCSGFLTYVYREFGVNLPRTAEEQYRKGEKVEKDDLAVGDLVFFATYKKTASHAGIYIGDNKFIHASSGKGVMISDLDESYWRKSYLGARRYFNGAKEVAALEHHDRLASLNVWR
ncbi:C40 family peptidase [Anoxybacillus sp. J5B_2022]|uniref:C40 family peptidase n=1 Tax=Anoxybacillus sp. J5B_2022 TaxID=3003246 RepID=UPI002285880C|nr:C40 family peptidase [Anoxybacillus sp. J5B_2022]MCZ0757090.1 C40 family peptidase [Anoxybacillus sp. J5B_2022]